MANKPTQPIFPLGLETAEQSKLAGVLNTGIIEHGPDAVMTVPEGDAVDGLPSAVRYNSASDEFEGYYENGGWLPLGGGGIRWEVLPHASTATLAEGRGYLVDNSSGVSTVVFPDPTRVGDSVTVCDLYGKFSVYPLTIDPNGHAIYGSTEPMTLSTDSVSATFTWSGDARGWIVTAGVGLGQGRVYSRTIFTTTLTSDTSQVTLATQPSIVDVYVDGKRLPESKYSLDGFNVNFSPALTSGSEVQIIQYVPIQLGAGGSGSGGGTVITWVYNSGSATGGETTITLDVDAEDVSELFINGTRQQKNLGFQYDSVTKVITLADELDAGDEVVVVINGDPTLYNQIDRTPNEVARAANVPVSQVILSSDTITVLDGKTVIYDIGAQKIWGKPSGIPNGSKIVSISGSNLTYTGGTVITLVPYAGSSEEFASNLLRPDGEKLIGYAATLVDLRSIEPSSNGQRITLREHTAGTGKGGGQFRSVLSGSSYTDNNGTIIKTTGGAAWLRINADVVNPLMFGAVADGTTNDTVAIQTAINTNAKRVEYPAGNYFVDVGTLVCQSDQEHVGYGATISHNSTLSGRSIFNAFEKNNLKFTNLNFYGPTSDTTSINCVSCSYVTVSQCNTRNLGLFSCKTRKAPQPYVSNDVGGAYALVTEAADYNYWINVTGCTSTGDGTGVLGGPFKVAGIITAYAKYVTISGNIINAHKEGIQWVGGDANPANDGAASNPRKCTDVTISGNTVINAVGGIWGSMGRNVVVTGNVVGDCKDVCIDFEGCFDCTASGNTTSNAQNGCLTTIWINRNIVFSGNIATISGENDTVIGGVYNSTASTENLSVSFVGNSFRNSGSSISFLKFEGCQNIILNDNTFVNVYVNMADFASVGTNHTQSASGNNFWFANVAAGYSYSALTIGNTSGEGGVSCANNRIFGLTAATGQYGIFLKQVRSTNQNAQMMQISGNTVKGYVNDLILNMTVPSSGKHLVTIQNNILATGGSSNASNSVNIVQANNYKPDGSAIAF